MQAQIINHDQKINMHLEYVGESDIWCLIIYMKKILRFDWLRAVPFLGNTVPKKEIQCQKRKFMQCKFL